MSKGSGAETRRALVAAFGQACMWCGRVGGVRGWRPTTHGWEVNPVCLTIDHVVPLAHGGPHCLANCQLLCPSCNTDKGDLRLDFRRTLPFGRRGPCGQCIACRRPGRHGKKARRYARRDAAARAC